MCNFISKTETASAQNFCLTDSLNDDQLQKCFGIGIKTLCPVKKAS